MKVVCTKALMILTCICVLQSSITSEAAETSAPKTAKKSLGSRLKQSVKDQAASITSAMTPSKIKNGIKVKLVKLDKEERKKLWTGRVVKTDTPEIVGKTIKFYRDTTVTFDPTIDKQTLQVFAGSDDTGTPTLSKDIVIKSGTISDADIKTQVLAASNTAKDLLNYLPLIKGISWMEKAKADQFITKQKELVPLQRIQTQIEGLQDVFKKSYIAQFLPPEHNPYQAVARYMDTTEYTHDLDLINELSGNILQKCINILKKIKSGLPKTNYPETLGILDELLSYLQKTDKDLWFQYRLINGHPREFIRNFLNDTPKTNLKFIHLLEAFKKELEKNKS